MRHYAADFDVHPPRMIIPKTGKSQLVFPGRPGGLYVDCPSDLAQQTIG